MYDFSSLQYMYKRMPSFMECYKLEQRSAQSLIGYFSLITLPYRYSINGTGMNAIARNPSMLFPHPSPNDSYIFGPASGSMAPNRQRSAVMPAMAEAANWGKQSIM